MSNFLPKNSHKIKKPHLGVIFAFSLACFGFFGINVHASDITADMVISLTNKARMDAQLPPLVRNEMLQKAAQKKVQDMIEGNYFAHVSPEGKSPWFWIEGEGYEYRYAGENLAINYTNAKEEQQAWMDSPLHRKNILNVDYHEIGVAVKEGKIDGKMTMLTVQMFGTKSSQETLIPATTILENTTPSVFSVLPEKNSSVEQKIVTKTDFGFLFEIQQFVEHNWFELLSILIGVTVIDILILLNRKYEQFLLIYQVSRQ
jgi:hypothetical protein